MTTSEYADEVEELYDIT